MTGKDGGQTSSKQSEGWRAWLGNLLIGLAGGMGVSLISGHVGYGGVAIGFAAGGILLGAVRLRCFPEEVRLVRVSSRAMLSVAAGCTILAAVVSVFKICPGLATLYSEPLCSPLVLQ